MLIATGTTQSTVNSISAALLLKSGSVSAAFFGAIWLVNEKVCGPGAKHVTVNTSFTIRGTPTASAVSVLLAVAGVIVAPVDAVAVLINWTSIGLDGPWLAMTFFSVMSTLLPISTSNGAPTVSKLAISRSATATTNVDSESLSLAGFGSGPARLLTAALFVIVFGPPLL